MVYIAYFTELNLQTCNYAQKRRICRENCKYAFEENFHGHFCPRRKAAKFCHPGLSWRHIWKRGFPNTGDGNSSPCAYEHCSQGFDQSRGDVAGQNKCHILKPFQNRKLMMEQYCNFEKWPTQPVNRISKIQTESYSCGSSLRESKRVKYLQLIPFFCQQGFELCSPKFVNLWNNSSMSQLSSLVLLMLMAILMVKMMMMNWWWLWLRSRLWILSIFGELHFQVLSEAMQMKGSSSVGLPALWETLPSPNG